MMSAEKSDLDRFDLHLLELLQRDSRQPASVLAETVGLSAPACYRRIRRLREIGAIEGEVAIVKPRTLGWNLSVIVTVMLDREDGPTIRELMAKIVDHPQVVDCTNVTGEIDLIVRMVARDMEHYDDAALKLFANDERVRSFKTFVIIREAHSSASALQRTQPSNPDRSL
ncbi:Lrp/AsnC family transcriptional regulator [Qipengyuania citrea]|nr:Lrp/AsnC family transcriptional regulator [Qipengyuania citrea]